MRGGGGRGGRGRGRQNDGGRATANPFAQSQSSGFSNQGRGSNSSGNSFNNRNNTASAVANPFAASGGGSAGMTMRPSNSFDSNAGNKSYQPNRGGFNGGAGRQQQNQYSGRDRGAASNVANPFAAAGAGAGAGTSVSQMQGARISPNPTAAATSNPFASNQSFSNVGSISPIGGMGQTNGHAHATNAFFTSASSSSPSFTTPNTNIVNTFNQPNIIKNNAFAPNTSSMNTNNSFGGVASSNGFSGNAGGQFNKGNVNNPFAPNSNPSNISPIANMGNSFVGSSGMNMNRAGNAVQDLKKLISASSASASVAVDPEEEETFSIDNNKEADKDAKNDAAEDFGEVPVDEELITWLQKHNLNIYEDPLMLFREQTEKYLKSNKDFVPGFISPMTPL